MANRTKDSCAQGRELCNRQDYSRLEGYGRVSEQIKKELNNWQREICRKHCVQDFKKSFTVDTVRSVVEGLPSKYEALVSICTNTHTHTHTHTQTLYYLWRKQKNNIEKEEYLWYRTQLSCKSCLHGHNNSNNKSWSFQLLTFLYWEDGDMEKGYVCLWIGSRPTQKGWLKKVL
jgi:hypothetical protein